MDEVSFKDEDGFEVNCSLSIPEKARSVVVMSHGFGSNKDSGTYTELESILNKKQIGTLRYNHCAFGQIPKEKGGKYAVARDVTVSRALKNLKAAVSFARSCGDYGVALLGASFGGLISHLYASQDHDIAALVLKSSIYNPVDFWRWRAGEKGIEQWEKQGWYHYSDSLEDYILDLGFWKDIQQYGAIDCRLSRIRCPTLIIHAGKDEIVPPSHAESLGKLIPGSELHILAEANHLYSNEGEKEYILQAISSFLIGIEGAHTTQIPQD